jgi:hypothetical protein
VAFAAPGNPNDDTRNFVRQNYLDFLNRAPDAAGFDFWRNQVDTCGADADCLRFKRVNTSGAFFLSIEFKDTGYFVYRLNKAAFGNLPGRPVPVRYEEFMPDTQRIGEGLVVNAPGWEQKLAANRDAFALEFVQRPAFRAAHAGQDATTFVNSLFTNAGVTPTDGERQALVSLLAANPDSARLRADALKAVADNPRLQEQERSKAFVLMQYFGYLRRNPDDAPELNRDFSGFSFWLGKLDDNGGDFIRAEMVRAFIESAEYRQRFRQ